MTQSLSVLLNQTAPAIGNHLWQSTLFAIAAGLFTLALRKNHARIRYALWLSASLKFLIPFSVFISLGSHLATQAAPAPTAFYTVVKQSTLPFTTQASPLRSVSSPLLALLPETLFFLWLCGFAIVLTRWAIRWQQIAATVRNAEPQTHGAEVESLRQLESTLQTRQPIPLLVSSDSMEPGIFGVFRPVLLWPAGISRHLGHGHLRAILIHELIHVRRRDNLAAAVHMLVEAIFWFNPIVWLLGARLIEERELACDEAVLQLRQSPEIYAESILKACEFCLESPFSCISGVTGSNLKRRMVRIMSQHRSRPLTSSKKLLITAFAATAIAAPILIGAATTPARSAQVANNTPLPSYEVVTFKPNSSSEHMTRIQALPDGFEATNASVRSLIEFAYHSKSSQLSGGPDWINTAHYDVEIKLTGSPTPDAPNQTALPNSPMQRVLQDFLATRFNLQITRGSRDATAYALVVSPTGSKLTAVPEPAVPKSADTSATKHIAIVSAKSMVQNANYMISLTGPISALADQLSSPLGAQVIDQTGLKGTYDIALHWTQDSNNIASLSAAVENQLGLTLQPSQTALPTYVISNIDQPTGAL